MGARQLRARQLRARQLRAKVLRRRAPLNAKVTECGMVRSQAYGRLHDDARSARVWSSVVMMVWSRCGHDGLESVVVKCGHDGMPERVHPHSLMHIHAGGTNRAKAPRSRG